VFEVDASQDTPPTQDLQGLGRRAVQSRDGPEPPGAEPGGRWRLGPVSGRHISDLHSLFALSRAMFGCEEESEILRLAMAQVSAVSSCSAEAGYLKVDEDLIRSPADSPGATTAIDQQVRELAERDGPVALPEQAWGWAFALRGLGGLRGYLVVGSHSRLDQEETFLLTVLVQQTSAALSNAAAYRRAREATMEVRRLREELETKRKQLNSALSDLEYQRGVDDALAQVATVEGGEDGIVQALHTITGLPAVIEDRFGNLKAWAGPGCPDPYPKPDPVRRQEMLQEVARGLKPLRIKERLIALAHPRGEVLGLVALVDPEGKADERTIFALEHAETSLALELAHLRNLAEAELRLRRDLVDDLLAGTDDASAYARSEAVGHDLHGPHYVVAVQWLDRAADDSFVQAVDRSASGLGMRSLLTRRSDMVVLVTQGRPQGGALYAALTREVGTAAGAIGVGSRCDVPRDMPRSYQEALQALEVRQQSRKMYGTTFFDDLGLYRILGPRNDYHEVEKFAREWLGRLLDYDSLHRTALVETLSQYFDCGGNYDETAAALAIHRSTLRYRLQRIREISGADLANVDSRLNLHVATRVWKIMKGGPG
jgi:sugar diacid utilization regulator